MCQIPRRRSAVKYFTILLVAAFAALIPVHAKIPDFIKVCKRNDPKMSQCVENSIMELRPRLGPGIPELAVPPLDPLDFDELKLELGTGFNAVITDLRLMGLHTLKFDDVFVDISTDTYSFNISVPQLTAHGKYSIDAALGGIPLKGNGPIYFAPKSVSGQGTIHGKKVVRGGKTFYYFPSMDLKLTIKDYEIRLDNLFEGDPTIGDVTNKLLNDEKTEVLASLIPGLEKAVIDKALLIGNNICKHFTWDELFPES